MTGRLPALYPAERNKIAVVVAFAYLTPFLLPQMLRNHPITSRP